jgi:phage-related protein
MKELVNKIPTVNADSIISDVKSKGVNIAKDMLSPPCGKIKPGGKSFITMLLEKLTSMLNNLAEMAINFVTKMVTNAINGAFDMIGNMRKLVIDIKNAISNILKNAKEELSKKIVGIVKGIYKELEEKYRQIVKIIEDVATFMEKEYNATIDKIEQYSEFVRCLVRTDTDIATL